MLYLAYRLGSDHKEDNLVGSEVHFQCSQPLNSHASSMESKLSISLSDGSAQGHQTAVNNSSTIDVLCRFRSPLSTCKFAFCMHIESRDLSDTI